MYDGPHVAFLQALAAEELDKALAVFLIIGILWVFTDLLYLQMASDAVDVSGEDPSAHTCEETGTRRFLGMAYGEAFAT